MTATSVPRTVHIVSHGPHCLDGVAAAVAIAKYRAGSEVRPLFSGNPKINEVLRGLDIEGLLEEQELWITDISWTERETNAHISGLVARGLPVYWIDHHRTAIERLASGKIAVPFTHRIVTDRYSAARLVFDYLQERLEAEGRESAELDAFRPVVMMADDNDRWVHEIPGSWELALALRALNSSEAFDELARVDEQVTYTPKLRAAYDRVEAEMKRSFEIAERTRTIRPADSGIRVVAAVCDGYPSEIADRWGKELPRSVFALFDLQGGAISYRRSPDCEIDLSAVAQAFGGGGHPAAAGSEMPEVLRLLSDAVAVRVAEAVGKR